MGPTWTAFLSALGNVPFAILVASYVLLRIEPILTELVKHMAREGEILDRIERQLGDHR
jgi:hypothetical protein